MGLGSMDDDDRMFAPPSIGGGADGEDAAGDDAWQ